MGKLRQWFTAQFAISDVTLGRSWTREEGFKFDPAPNQPNAIGSRGAVRERPVLAVEALRPLPLALVEPSP